MASDYVCVCEQIERVICDYSSILKLSLNKDHLIWSKKVRLVSHPWHIEYDRLLTNEKKRRKIHLLLLNLLFI